MPEPVADRILPTALMLFGEHGYHGTTMQMIADALGVTRAAFYYHFRSKQDVLEVLAAPVVAAFEALADDSDGPATADALLSVYLDALLDHQRVLRFVANDPAVRSDEAVGDRLRIAWERMQARLASRTSGPDRDLRAACALGALSAGVLSGSTDERGRVVILDASVAVLRAAERAEA